MMIVIQSREKYLTEKEKTYQAGFRDATKRLEAENARLTKLARMYKALAYEFRQKYVAALGDSHE